jgi:hypothetical protein
LKNRVKSSEGGFTVLCQLIFTSDVRALGTWTMPDLLADARPWTQASGISGVLLMNHRHILECLEGPADAVCAGFERIASAFWHTNVTPLSLEPTVQRDFPDWSMGFVGTNVAHRGPLSPLLTGHGFTPKAMALDDLRHLMIGARKLAYTVA